MTRATIFVSVWLAVAAVGAPAAADVPVRFDCYLPAGPVECRALGTAYHESIAYLRAARDEERAVVTVRVRATAVRDGARVFADFAGAGTGATRFTLEETVPSRVTRDAALVQLVGVLQRGTVPFLSVAAGRTENGALRIEAVDPSAAGRARARSAEDDATRWYVSPSLSAELFEGGASMTAFGAGAETSWSHPEWRLVLAGQTRYRRVHLKLSEGEAIDGEFFGGGGDAVIARTVHGGFSLALLGGGERATEKNVDARAGAGAGAEWVLRPFLRADENGFGLRYRVRAEHHDYVVANVDGDEERWVPLHRASAFVRWHTERLDVGLEVSGQQVIGDLRFWEVGGEVEIAWRLIGDVQLELQAGVAWRGGVPNEPGDPSQLDPAAALIGGNDFGSVAWEGGLELSYAFGSSLLRAQDQRWR